MDTIKTLNKTLDNIDSQIRDILLNAYVGFFGEAAREKVEKTLDNLILEIRPNGDAERMSNSNYWGFLLDAIKNREQQIFKEFVPKENQADLNTLEYVNIGNTFSSMLQFGISSTREDILKLIGIDTEKIWGKNSTEKERKEELARAQDLVKTIYKKIRTDKSYKLYNDINSSLTKLNSSTKTLNEKNRIEKQKIEVDNEYFEKIISLLKEYSKIDINDQFDFAEKDIDKKVGFVHDIFYSDYNLKDFLKECNAYPAIKELPDEKIDEFIDKFYSICYEHQSKIIDIKAPSNIYFSRLAKKINDSELSEKDKQFLLFYTINCREGISGFNYSTTSTNDGRIINFISLSSLNTNTIFHEFFHAFGNRIVDGQEIYGFYHKGEKYYLNEAITEFMARKIDESYSGQTSILMQQFKNDEYKAADYGAMIVLIEDLLESWEPKIKEYMLSDDTDKLEKFKDEVGREDFEELQVKLYDFYKLYSHSENSDFIKDIAEEKNIEKSIENKEKLNLNENDSKLYDLSIEIKQLTSTMVKENRTEDENEL